MDSFEILHGDSDPQTGKYQVWFWAFPAGVIFPDAGLSGDKAGAWKLLKVLLENRPMIKSTIDMINPVMLATFLYDTGYYAGFHDPRVPGGREKNIADYGSGLAWRASDFRAALVGRYPGGEPVVDKVSPDISVAEGLQTALNIVGAEPKLSVDGIMGPKTVHAVMLFQKNHGLIVDGKVGSQTRAMLEKELMKARFHDS
jgi:hypothetical protein